MRELIILHHEKLQAGRDSGSGRDRGGHGHASDDGSTFGDGHHKSSCGKKCFGCGKRGHVKSERPEKSKSTTKSDSRSASDKSKPKGKPKDTKAGFCDTVPVNHMTQPQLWYFDSGCRNHLRDVWIISSRLRHGSD